MMLYGIRINISHIYHVQNRTHEYLFIQQLRIDTGDMG